MSLTMRCYCKVQLRIHSKQVQLPSASLFNSNNRNSFRQLRKPNLTARKTLLSIPPLKPPINRRKRHNATSSHGGRTSAASSLSAPNSPSSTDLRIQRIWITFTYLRSALLRITLHASPPTASSSLAAQPSTVDTIPPPPPSRPFLTLPTLPFPEKLGLSEFTMANINKFQLVPVFKDIRVLQVACGDYHTIALTGMILSTQYVHHLYPPETDQVYSWGGTLHNKVG